MPQITAIIFDYGNVLSLPQQPSDFEDLARVLDIGRVLVESLYWKYRVPYDKGEWSADRYWNQIAEDAETKFNQKQIEDAINVDVTSWLRCNKDVVGWAAQLTRAGLKTAILSNMPHDLRKRINADGSWLPKFDHHTYSCVLNVVKPQAQIYEHCVGGLGVNAQETLFIDDRQENIDAALAFGMNAILFESTQGLSKLIARDYSSLPALNCPVL